ncbi:unnamed protein product, partial [Polarella glacialis]
GTFENGMYKVGTYTSSGGAVFAGNFRNNKFHGVGEYRWPDGRVYRGTWHDGDMHGRGQYLNFSVGADKAFTGFSLNGKFASAPRDQEEAKKAFLAEYGGQCVKSATAALRELAEKTSAEGVPATFLVPQDQSPESVAEKAHDEEIVDGPFPEASGASQASLQAFVARLAEGAEKPLEVTTYSGLGAQTRLDSHRLKRPQLQMVGQAVEFFAPDAEAGAVSWLLLVNVRREFDLEHAKWKLIQCEAVQPPA